MAIESQIEPGTKPSETSRKKQQSHPRLIVFLVCFVISIFMWLFIELMKDYDDELKYTINYTNVPKDLILINSGDSVINIGMNAQGFELLVAKYARSKRTVTIDLSTLRVRQAKDGYTAYIPSSRIIEQLGSQIRFENGITSVKPDTLFFLFSEIFHRQVPVKPDLEYTLSSQYDLTDSIIFSPKSVNVSSIKSIIDTLSFVKTQKLQFSQLDSSVSAKVALYKGPHAALMKFSNDSVTIKLKVEQVTEAGFTVPVSVAGNNENIKIFPDKVEVTCRIALSEYPHIQASDFSAQVDYQTSLSKDKKLQVRLVKSPGKIRILKIIPSEVEYIIIAK